MSGDDMTKRLDESDRRAVDLLLDRTSSAANGEKRGDSTFVAHAQHGLNSGMSGVQRVLSLLERMPAEEPGAHLIASTMARIEAQGVMGSVHSVAATQISGQPHA